MKLSQLWIVTLGPPVQCVPSSPPMTASQEGTGAAGRGAAGTTPAGAPAGRTTPAGAPAGGWDWQVCWNTESPTAIREARTGPAAAPAPGIKTTIPASTCRIGFAWGQIAQKLALGPAPPSGADADPSELSIKARTSFWAIAGAAPPE